MEARAIRISTAINCTDSDNDGRNIWTRLPARFVVGGIQITGGTQCSNTDVSKRNIVASQKFGNASPISPAARAQKSVRLLRLMAESTPSGMATTTDITMARNANSSVMGRLATMLLVIGSRVRND